MIAKLTASEAAELAAQHVGQGARFVWLFHDRVDGSSVLRYIVEQDGVLESFEGTISTPVTSLSERLPAARWYEQEVRERYSVNFSGLLDHAPIIHSPERKAAELRRTLGDEISTVLYGPIRSGIVESVCWLIETAGEDFIAVQPTMFFKHRKLEQRFEGTALELAPFVAEHVSGVTPSSHAVAFCRAMELLFGIDVPPRAQATRAILVEIERIHQHLDSLAKLADDGSLAVGSAQTFAAKERLHRFLAAATGHRFGRGSICVGGVREDFFPSMAAAAERALDEAEHAALSVVEGLFGTQSLLDRLIGTGRISEEVVRTYGGVGPVARGSGVMNDARLTDGWLFAPLKRAALPESSGDAMARARVREMEIGLSFQLVRNALNSAPSGAHRVSLERQRLPSGTALARVESPQGELFYSVHYDGGIRRVAIRSASFANWPLFVPSLPGNIFTDFSFIEHSFGLIQAETDR